MPQIVPAGSINLTALQDPDLYVQILQPPPFIRGVPTDVIGVVGTAAWGPVNQPIHMGSGQEAQLAFGPISTVSVLDPYDLATDLYLAFGQVQSNASLEGFAVRVTDGTDTAATVALAGAATGTPATAALTGSITVGDIITLTATSAALLNSPVSVNYTTRTGDTLASAAVALAALINSQPSLNAAAVYASVSGATVTMFSPSGLAPPIVWTRLVSGPATETVTIGTSSATTAGATATALNTGSLGSQVSMTFVTSPNIAGALNVTVSGFSGTAEFYPNIPVANFWRNLQTALSSGVAGFRGPSAWVRLSAINAAVGAPVVGVYPLVGGTDGRAVSTSQLLGSASATPRTGIWAMSATTPNVGIAWIAGMTDVSGAATMDAFALSAGASVLFPFPTGVSTTAAIAAIQTDGIGGPEFIYVKDSIYFQDPVNNMRRLVLPTPVIGGAWAILSPEQSPLNKRVQLVLGTERTDPVNGNIAYTPSEIGQLNSAGVLFITNPCPGGTYFGVRTAASTSPNAATAPVEYWRLTMYIARSIESSLGIFVGQLQSQQPNDDLRNQVKLVLNSFATVLAAANQIDSGIGFCEFSAAPNAKFGNGVNTPQSVAQHYMYALFKATYLSSVWFFVVSIQGGTTVVTVAPGQA